MISYSHYEPDRLTAPMATKSTILMLFALTAPLRLNMEHLDIKGTLLQEAFGYGDTVYIKDPKRTNGNYKHGGTVGVLRGNMYGGRSAGNYFLKGLIVLLHKHGYSPTYVDPCLYFKRTAER